MSGPAERLHASAVAIAGAAVLIRGPSGAGKSSLALRLIDAGARLIADDRTVVAPGIAGLEASAPGAMRGRMEVRGLGIVTVPHEACAPLALVVDLVAAEQIARLPEAAELRCALLGHEVARVAIDPCDPAAAARVRIALDHLAGPANSRTRPLVSPSEQ